jgi:ATP-binding protein involved in chromosome partitioning
MKIAIPIVNGRLSMHFGHCEQFALVDVDPEEKKILSKQMVPSPQHQRGALPDWLSGQGADVVITGGMGGRAQGLFSEKGIQVVAGTPDGGVDELVMNYLEGRFSQGPDACDHSQKPCHDDD